MGRPKRADKEKAIRRMLSSKETPLQVIAEEMNVSLKTLDRWKEEAIEAVSPKDRCSLKRIVMGLAETFDMTADEKNGWCRGHGVYPMELESWMRSMEQIFIKSKTPFITPEQSKELFRKISELEKALRRKEKALAETAALLVLSKKLEAIFQAGEDA